MITYYINKTTMVKDESTNEEIKVEFTPTSEKNKTKDPWKQTEQLTLTESEYHRLASLLLFQIILPRDGYSEAQATLKKLPMQLKMKQQFAEVLNQEFTSRLKQCEHIYGERPLK